MGKKESEVIPCDGIAFVNCMIMGVYYYFFLLLLLLLLPLLMSYESKKATHWKARRHKPKDPVDYTSLMYEGTATGRKQNRKIGKDQGGRELRENEYVIPSQSTLRGHSKKLYKKRPKKDAKKYSFPDRAIDKWNAYIYQKK